MVITAAQSGAEAIPFIKVWVILPCAIALTVLFTRLIHRMSREKVFYVMMGIFLIFFAIFTFVLYPYQDALHPHALADQLQSILPDGMKGFVAIFRNWTFTLFYVMSELWGTAILTVLFWGFANEVTSVSEAKRYYVLWSIGANMTGIIAGQMAVHLSQGAFIPWLSYGSSVWDQSVLFINCIVMVCGICTMGLLRYLTKHLQPAEEKLESTPAPKMRMSLWESILYLVRSRYLLYIAILVLAYNLSMNLVEVVWKNQIKELYPSANDYNGYMGEVMTWMGVVATLISIFVSGNMLRKFSWVTSALVTPLIVLIVGALFFAFALFDHIGTFLFGLSPLILSVMVGSWHNCMTRACKHTLFDATKEMSFIPLSSEAKLKGKAAIDGVGSRLGKSGGAVIHQGLLLIFATVSASTPYVAVIFFIVVFLWILAVMALGKQFDALTGVVKQVEPLKEQELSTN
jgi:AAA family ATP:ADP antiporter